MQVAAESDVVILAVKPDILPSVLQEIEPHLSDDALVMSIAAGIQLPVLEEVRLSIVRHYRHLVLVI